MTHLDVDPLRYATHFSDAPGFRMAYVRENPGGVPLVLTHGWPESKRLFWKVIEPLAVAGFEVIVPDLRGFGDSAAPGDGYDLETQVSDVLALVRDELGHQRVVLVGGDMGGSLVQAAALREPDWVDRMVLYNSPLQWIPELMGDIPGTRPAREASDYFQWQGRDADALAAEFATPTARRRYISTFYTSRFWAHPGSFAPEEVDFHVEPFADAEKLRAGFRPYESAFAPASSHASLGKNPRTLTMILHGTSDHVMYPSFDLMAAATFPRHVGPFQLRDCGHFVPWEAPGPLVTGIVAFCSDLLASARKGPLA